MVGLHNLTSFLSHATLRTQPHHTESFPFSPSLETLHTRTPRHRQHPPCLLVYLTPIHTLNLLYVLNLSSFFSSPFDPSSLLIISFSTHLAPYLSFPLVSSPSDLPTHLPLSLYLSCTLLTQCLPPPFLPTPSAPIVLPSLPFVSLRVRAQRLHSSQSWE
jgi:hypothetical protein